MRSTGSIVRILPAAMLFTFACSSTITTPVAWVGAPAAVQQNPWRYRGRWRHAIEHRWNRFRRLDGNSDRRALGGTLGGGGASLGTAGVASGGSTVTATGGTLGGIPGSGGKSSGTGGVASGGTTAPATVELLLARAESAQAERHQAVPARARPCNRPAPHMRVADHGRLPCD